MSRGEQRLRDDPGHIVQAMRNAVAHGYFAVDLGIVWKTIHSGLPAPYASVQALVAGLPEKRNEASGDDSENA